MTKTDSYDRDSDDRPVSDADANPMRDTSYDPRAGIRTTENPPDRETR